MYLHIGKDVLIDNKNIIAILKYDSIKKNINNFKLVDAANEDIKSLILVKEKDEVKGYLSSISVSTLEKRAKLNINT